MSYDYRETHKKAGKAAKYAKKFETNPHRRLVWQFERRFLSRVCKNFYDGMRIDHLDFACGTGRILWHLRGHVDSSVGVDVSEEMLTLARGVAPETEIIQADLTRDDVLCDRKFNLITAFRFFPNAQAELRNEAMGVLVDHLADSGHIVFNNHMNTSSTLARWQRFRGSGEASCGMSDADVRELAASFGLRIVDTYHVGVLPASERRMLLPLPVLSVFERVASMIPPLRRFAQNVVYVCSHAEEIPPPGLQQR